MLAKRKELCFLSFFGGDITADRGRTLNVGFWQRNWSVCGFPGGSLSKNLPINRLRLARNGEIESL